MEFEAGLSPNDILNRVLGADKPTYFLTMLPDSTDFILVHSLSRFNVSLGAANRFHAKVFAMVGDTVEVQLPPLLEDPPGPTLLEDQLFGTGEYLEVT